MVTILTHHNISTTPFQQRLFYNNFPTKLGLPNYSVISPSTEAQLSFFFQCRELEPLSYLRPQACPAKWYLILYNSKLHECDRQKDHSVAVAGITGSNITDTSSDVSCYTVTNK